MAAKIRKGDKVVVLSGRSKGKTGAVLKVFPKEMRALVQGVNTVKRHTRATAKVAGGIVEQEAPIHISNLAHVDPETGRPSRVGFRTLEDGRKVRYAKRSGEVLDR
jgi:large subunit ribosomal protein L24